jgi:hypothetical protein
MALIVAESTPASAEVVTQVCRNEWNPTSITARFPVPFRNSSDHCCSCPRLARGQITATKPKSSADGNTLSGIIHLDSCL